MNDEIDKMPPEEDGDGLPNMQWRLRVIVVTTLGSVAAWTALIFLI